MRIKCREQDFHLQKGSRLFGQKPFFGKRASFEPAYALGDQMSHQSCLILSLTRLTKLRHPCISRWRHMAPNLQNLQVLEACVRRTQWSQGSRHPCNGISLGTGWLKTLFDGCRLALRACGINKNRTAGIKPCQSSFTRWTGTLPFLGW